MEEPEAHSLADRCECGHKRKNHGNRGCGKCYDKGRDTYEHAFEAGEGWPCGDCGANVSGKLDWCPACAVAADFAAEAAKRSCACEGDGECPCPSACGCCQVASAEGAPPCKFPEGCHRVAPCEHGCAWPASMGPWVRDDEIARQGLVQMPRRPPYAVAYAIEGGHLYEVLLPGDARVTAEDGVLKISHPTGAVLALVQAGPMEVADGAGPERPPRPDDPGAPSPGASDAL